MRYDFLLCGVGGQGIITLSDIVANAAISKGIKAIVTQDRGLAQRGGSVKAHIRLGEVHSPMIPRYAAHALLSLEMNEVWNYVDYLNKDTVVAINTDIHSSNGKEGGEKDKLIQKHQRLIDLLASQLLFIDAESKSAELGIPRGANIFMLGIIMGMDPRLSALIGEADMLGAIQTVVRKSPQGNIKVFQEGKLYGERRRNV